MNLFIRAIRRLSRELDALSERLEYARYDEKTLIYRDCFETVRVLTELHRPKYLCDIGANKGNWTYVMHQLNPALEHVVLFEPQKKLAAQLQSLQLPGVHKVVYSCGLGAHEETRTIKGGTASASFLDAGHGQTLYFPGSVNSDEESAEIRVLDAIYEADGLPYPDVVKIDVQGYELNVLKGALQVISKAKYLVVELSFREFYQGQPALWELLRFLEEHDYVLLGRGYESRSAQNQAELLQVDGIFVNRRAELNLSA